MIKKKVKEYSKRKRIELNQSDNIDAGAEVIILSENEYNQLLDKINDYDALKKENQILNEQENNLSEMVKDITAPIYDQHKKDLQKKDNEIKQLTSQLNYIRKSISHYIISLSSLSLMDLIFKTRHKKIIQDMNDTIFHDADADADVPAMADTKKIE